MDLGKESRMFAMYSECWVLMKKYSAITNDDGLREYLREAREMEDKYHEYRNLCGAMLYHYGKLIEREIKDGEAM